MEASESRGVPSGKAVTGEKGTKEKVTREVSTMGRAANLYSDTVLTELLNLQSETELLFAQLQALSRSQPAAVG